MLPILLAALLYCSRKKSRPRSQTTLRVCFQEEEKSEMCRAGDEGNDAYHASLRAGSVFFAIFVAVDMVCTYDGLGLRALEDLSTFCFR